MAKPDPLKELETARTHVLVELANLNTLLESLQEDFPGLFAKRVQDYSIADKLRFSGDLIDFIKVRDQYALSNTQGR